MGKIDSCYKCQKRAPHCHSSCPEYAAQVEINKAAYRARQELQGADQADMVRGRKIKADVRLRGLAGNRRRSK